MVINPDSVQNDVALAVQGDRIAAIGPTEAILKQYPNADVYNGRGKALVAGLVNCHAHLGATLARGFNEDFGFPNSAKLAVQPDSLLQGEEATLMATVGALEAMRTGTTTMVEFSGGIGRHAAALAQDRLAMGLRRRRARQRERPGSAVARRPGQERARRASRQKLREEGMQRINELFSKWHGANGGRISVFPAASLAETSSPELMQAVRAFAEKHDLGYTIHLSQSRAEVDFMKKHHGMTPPAFLAKHGYLGPRLFAAHCRYVDDADVALLGKSRTIVSHQAAMAANRGVIPPIHKLRAAGCPIALGTDNNTNDVFEVMRIALHYRAHRSRRSVPGRAAATGRHARRRDDGRRSSGPAVEDERHARGRQESRPPGGRHAPRPPRAGGALPVGVDSQRPGLRHRIVDD